MIRLFFSLLFVATIFAAFLQIHTLVTGQDPRIFVVLARQIAEQNFSLTSIREVARFIIPGYPLFLAAIIRTLGVEATFWVNSFLLTGVMFLLQRIFFHFVRNEWQAGIMTFFCLTGLLAGFSRNSHFLLLTFRNTPVYLCMIGALWCLLRSGDQSKNATPWLAVAAGILLLIGTAIRETVILIIPAFLCFLFLDPATPSPASRRSRRLAFLAPFAISILPVAAILLIKADLLLNAQSHQLLRIYTMLLDHAANVQAFRIMSGFILDEMGIVGILLLLIGVWRARKRPDILCLFLLPAITYFVFYGFIKVHRRFFLSTLFFLLPLAGWGLMAIVEWIRRRPALSRLHPATIYLLTTAGIAIWCSLTIQRLTVWGVKVTSDQIEHMTELLKTVAPGEKSLLVDRRTRFLIDALTVFTDYEPVSASDPTIDLVRHPPRIFIMPLNDAAIHSIDQGLAGKVAVLRQGSMASTDIRFSLDRTDYEVMKVIPWTNRVTHHLLAAAPAYPAILRVTAPMLWRHSPPRNTIHLSVDGRIVMDQMEMGANYVIIDQPPSDGDGHDVMIESDAPIPSDFEPAWFRLDESIDMNFGEMDHPSHDHFLSREFFQFPSPNPGARELPSSGFIRMPVIYPSDTYLMALLGASTVHDEPDIPVDVILSLGQETLGHASMRASSKMNAVLVHLGVVGTNTKDRIALRLRNQADFRHPPIDERGMNYVIHNIIFYPTILREGFSLKVGVRGDTPFVSDGFWRRESPPGGAGRWTKEQATIPIPLLPGPNYLLRIRYQTSRVDAAPPPNPVFTWNGQPFSVTRETTSDFHRAEIPSSWITQPSNALVIGVTPWRPSEYQPLRDNRSLGIFLQQVEVIAQP